MRPNPAAASGAGEDDLIAMRKKREQAENLRSMFVAMADDWRIVGAKPAGRLHTDYARTRTHARARVYTCLQV